MEHILSLWTFPVIILAAFLIAWAAECGQFYVSQGMALAILAWLKTLPEFAVEAVIAWQAGQDPEMMHFVTANFTGSLRLFVGLGWPMIFFISYFMSSKHKGDRSIKLEKEHAITVVAFVPVLVYMLFVYAKSSLNVIDGVVLFAMYGVYLFWLSKMPAQEHESLEELGGPPKRIMALPPRLRIAVILGCLVFGVAILLTCAHPFVESMLHIALILGMSQFVFVQWVAPILSEFPEKVSAFYWAKTNRGSMGLINFVSSCVNQWTMLIGMVPFIVAMSAGHFMPVTFDEFQRVEIMLTILQGALGMLFLFNMEFKLYEAAGLFVLWLLQFLVPALRFEMQFVYGAWLAVEFIRLPFSSSKRNAFVIFMELTKQRVIGAGK